LGVFEVTPDEGRLVGPTGERRLEPKVMAVLAELMHQPGEVVTRQQLLDRVWPGLVVTDDALTRCISELRHALGDDRQKPRYLETLPKRGYRLLVIPEPAHRPASQAAPPAAAPPDTSSLALSPPIERAGVVTAGRPRYVHVHVYVGAALVALALVAAWRWATVPKALPSVAIVPFSSGTDTAAETRYFAEGLAEELLNALVRVKGLQVASRSSSFAAADAANDPLAAARALGVDTVLTGTLRRTGGRVRLNAELIDARTGFHLWAQSYDRELEGVFAMQDDIATQVARALGVASTPVQVARVSSNMQAFDYYLLGRYHWHKRTPEALERSIEFFQQAIALDPDFARAYAGIADAYLLLAMYGDFPGDRAAALARQSIERALALDPGLAEAHASQGMLAMHQEDYPSAERALRRAVSLDPHYAMAAMWLGSTLEEQGRINEALAALTKARAIDPAHPVIRFNLAHALMAHGDYADAEVLMNDMSNAGEADSGLALSNSMLALKFALDLGRLDDATKWAKQLLAEPKKEHEARIALAEIARQRGDPAAAREWLATAASRQPEASYEIYIATLEQHALDGDAAAFDARVARWRSESDAAARPTALELGWQGVLETHESKLPEAVKSLEAALALHDPKMVDPVVRLWAIGHLLLALDTLDDRTSFETWRTTGTEELKAARASGFGSVRYLLQEAYFYAAAGIAHDAVSDLAQIVALGARLSRIALDEPRLGPIRNTPELRAFLASLSGPIVAREAGDRVLTLPPSVATASPQLVQDSFRAENPSGGLPGAVPGTGDTVTQVSDCPVQGS
jgi:TolB-like protein/DNA-binding winged helix-turn-helix (wHTH) protein/Flp pilus assembly protein TadD